MTTDEFKACLVTYYQTEVFGEAFFESLIKKFEEPDHRYKIGCLLQLETETKARLRPTMLELGASVEEEEQSRQTGREIADSISSGNWQEFIAALNEAGEPLLQRQREVAASAPAIFRELAESMLIHGESFQHFTDREAAGDAAHSIDKVVEQLKFPLPAPRMSL
jgi:hypothetical protein